MNTMSSTIGKQQVEISPVDALWVLIQSQTKTVRQALKKRILEDEEVTMAQKKMVSESLKTAFEELHSGKAKHNARALFAK